MAPHQERPNPGFYKTLIFQLPHLVLQTKEINLQCGLGGYPCRYHSPFQPTAPSLPQLKATMQPRPGSLAAAPQLPCTLPPPWRPGRRHLPSASILTQPGSGGPQGPTGGPQCRSHAPAVLLRLLKCLWRVGTTLGSKQGVHIYIGKNKNLFFFFSPMKRSLMASGGERSRGIQTSQECEAHPCARCGLGRRGARGRIVQAASLTAAVCLGFQCQDLVWGRASWETSRRVCPCCASCKGRSAQVARNPWSLSPGRG